MKPEPERSEQYYEDNRLLKEAFNGIFEWSMEIGSKAAAADSAGRKAESHRILRHARKVILDFVKVLKKERDGA